MDVGNLISDSSAFSESSLNTWNFLVHVLLKTNLKDFEYYLASMWNECNCAVLWTFFGITLPWGWKENLIHFSSLIPEMSMFILAISCLTTSNLPWFMDLTFHVPVQHYSLQHQTLISPTDTSTAGHHFCFCSASSFLLKLFLCSSPVTFWYLLTWGFIFQCHIFLPFHTVHEVLKARMLKWFAIPFSSGPLFVRTLHCDLSILGDPTYVAPSFIKLQKTMFHVIILFSFLWLWF